LIKEKQIIISQLDKGEKEQIYKFKTWHGITSLSIQGKKRSAAEETIEPFLQKLHKVI